MLFISDVFIRIDADSPRWLELVGDLFPLKHRSAALQTAFNPFETGSGLELTHLGIVALWGVFGVVIALSRFSWAPRD